MSVVLTGIQPTGVPHLGNIIGAIEPTIEIINSSNSNEKSFVFIADLHSLTNLSNLQYIKHNSYSIAAAWISLGLNLDKVLLYKQSDVPQVTEMMWYLSNYYSYNRLTLCHAFKDKKSYFEKVNTGLFIYPILMSADILLYNPDIVVVGQDQKQHLEICRNIAKKINNTVGHLFKVPKLFINKNKSLLIGLDGYKMSKSRNNIINIFGSDKDLYKQIMSIKTSSLSIEEPKCEINDNIFNIYKMIANNDSIDKMRNIYLKGGYSYLQAKKDLFHLIIEKYKDVRYIYNNIINDTKYLDNIFVESSNIVSSYANKMLDNIRNKFGFN